MIKIFDALVLLGYCGVLYGLSAQNVVPVTKLFYWEDKLHHFAAYWVLGILAWRSFRHGIRRLSLIAVAVSAFGSLYGLSDEWHQFYVPGRTADAADWLADTLGAGMAAAAALYYTKRALLVSG